MREGDPLRIGIIGAGFWGRNHARVLSEMRGVTLSIVCDIDEAKAEELARKYHAASYTRDYEEILRRDDIDAVIICTPSNTHAEICLKALELGKNVLVEKPMAADISEGISIVESANSNRRAVMVGFIERFNPVIESAKNVVSSGRIGEPLLIYGRRIGPWPERVGDVGVVKDTAIHDIDLSRYFLGASPSRVYANGGSLRHTQEDYVQALLSFADSRCAVLEANWLTPRKKRELRITGTDGVVHVELLSKEMVIEKSNGLIMPTQPQVEPLRNELRYFVEGVAEGRELIPNAVDGLWSIVIAEAIIRSMRRGREQSVEEIIDEHGLNDVLSLRV